MRVTNNQMANAITSSLFKQAQRLLKAQITVATEKIINKPSDDPIGIYKILDCRKVLSSIDQYNRNITKGKTLIEFSETTLEEIETLLNTAKDIAVDQSSGDLDTRESALQEVENIYGQVLSLSNTRLGNRYIFSGHKTNTAPFRNEVSLSGGVSDDIVFGLVADAPDVTIKIYNSAGEVVRTLTPASGTAGTNTVTWDGNDDGGVPCLDGRYTFEIEALDAGGDEVLDYVVYHGSDDDFRLVIGKNVEIDINADGDEIFSGIFETLSQLQSALEDPDYDPNAVSSLVEPLNDAVSQIQKVRAEGAATYTRMELTENQLASFRLKVENMLSGTEDADMASAIVELQAQETAYETVLAVAARIIQPSLINFLS
jgi:flagellar hook-associated protein 3 FlgL